MGGIERFASGGPWEAGFGYSRAVRAGDLLLVAGTTAIDEDGVVRGIGAGQMSRVDSVRLAVDKSRLESLQGAVLASDAFFPFSDGPEIAIGAGISAIIQPGGSRNDPAVRDAADAAGIAMVFTSRRHFRH